MSPPAHRLSQVASHLGSSSSPHAPPSRSSPAISTAPLATKAGSTSSAEATSASTEGAKSNAEAQKARPGAPTADQYRFFLPFQTRWTDNDQYSHANNVVYSLYFDSITNFYLINHVPRPSPTSSPPLGLIVSSSTAYASSVAYPSPVIAALGVSALGKSSVTWRVALFEGEYVDPLSSSVAGGSLAGWTLQDVLQSEGGAGRLVRLKKQSQKDGPPPRAAAYGEMVHVFVDPETRRPLPGGMDGTLRAALEKLMVEG
ncbi:hypothetical protein JCM10908_001825 [Rhodotorula pacifica]|uniref:acyl-CoA thioesterase n=1 Tax=Rhodotorula pacifica TaxID=1495444 RepID=UPI0031764593